MFHFLQKYHCLKRVMTDTSQEPSGPQPMRLRSPGDILWALGIFIVLFLILVWILQFCWNSSVPYMFSGAKEITYATAFFFLIVALIIFPRPYVLV